jgi:CD109 antigen
MAGRVSRRQFIRGVAGVTSSIALVGGFTLQRQPFATAFQAIHEADGYLAVAPRVLRVGQAEAVGVSLFRGESPAGGAATVELLKDGQAVLESSAQIVGKGSVPLALPSLTEGQYQLRVSAAGFQDQAPIRVEDGTLVFVETDKPIYKPGQTVHIRALALDGALKPAGGQAVIEAMDAKGIKVFKQTVPFDDFGMAELDLPLSTEPNLGVWKVSASLGKRASQVDVRVERYVLPKYEVKLDLPREWALASQPIAGTVSAEYSFGKPVNGEVELVASRYVGTWQEYARVTRPLQGKQAFEIPPVGFAAGSPAARGMASVRLQAVVREQATGYEEQTDRLVTIASSPVGLRVVAESATFKPGLPFSLLVLAQTPDRKPVDTEVELRLTYQDERLAHLKQDTQRVSTRNGLAALKLTPPAGAASLSIQPSAKDATGAGLTLRAGYSPSGSFIHVEQLTQGPLKVGDTVQFRVAATREAKHFYYEVLARGKLVYTDVSSTPEFSLTLSPLMAPEMRLLVYQLLPNAEVAADYLPVRVQGSYPHPVQLSFDRAEARPGDELDVFVQAQGVARVGLAAVDRSVFILAENRLNLQQVFDELERLYMQPQVELHEAEPLFGPLPGPPRDFPLPLGEGQGEGGPGPGGQGEGGPGGRPAIAAPIAPAPRAPVPPSSLPGAKEVFESAGLLVLTNRQVPAGKQLQPQRFLREALAAAPAAKAAGAPQPTPAPAPADAAAGEPLAEVQRVRQFFPETWLWTALTTDAAGRAAQRVTAPDSITTWMARVVALSKESGLGIAEAELRVFQPFFVQVDLPYSAIRGEQLPASVALYNYEPTPQDFVVELEPAAWFELLDERVKTARVAPSNVGGVSFTIRPRSLGVGTLKVTARSRGSADAILKELLVEPEGVEREVVDNLVLTPGARRVLDFIPPPLAVAGSSRAYLALTGNVLSHTMEGLEGLLKMPFGCGEQNMILFAPNVFVSRYLKETGQLKPEVLAKAEKLMLTGYQRQLTYRRADGSFSAFGQQDRDGSLWLTAFVLKTFAQAADLLYIDEAVQAASREWVRRQQRPDGSFEPVGFVHHQELLGGLRGKTALTAFVAVALREAADDAAPAIRYLESRLPDTADAYSLALLTYTLALASSPRAGEAQAKLMSLARESDEGLFWDDRPEGSPLPLGEGQGEGGAGQGEGVPRAGAQADDILPPPGGRRSAVSGPPHSTAVEATAYATLALLQLGDRVNASHAVRWLASKRNAQGGFGSTQDTVVALQAMASAAALSRADVDATVVLQAGPWRKEVRVTPDNADVLQIVEIPGDALAAAGGTADDQASAPQDGRPPSTAPGSTEPPTESTSEPRSGGRPSAVNGPLVLETHGTGQVMAQAVHRYNLRAAQAAAESPFQVSVVYDANQVAVNDLIAITASISFFPPEPIAAGMVVLDVSIPTGFAAVTESLDQLPRQEPLLKRWELAGRKVILYIENMLPGDNLAFRFQARALYPVRAQPVASQAYAYYRPEWRGESLGAAVSVGGG